MIRVKRHSICSVLQKQQTSILQQCVTEHSSWHHSQHFVRRVSPEYSPEQFQHSAPLSVFSPSVAMRLGSSHSSESEGDDSDGLFCLFISCSPRLTETFVSSSAAVFWTKISSDLSFLFNLLEVCFCTASSSKRQQILCRNVDVLQAVLVSCQRHLQQD